VQDWEQYDEDMGLDDLIGNGEDFLLHYQRLDLTAAVCQTPNEKRAQGLAKKKKGKDEVEEAPAPVSKKARTKR
jgi:hypothetical protein